MNGTEKENTVIVEQNKKIETCMKYICEQGYVLKMNRYMLCLVILMTIGFFLAGTHSCQSMGDMAVYLSWIIYFVPLFFSWIGCIGSMRIKDEMTEKQHKNGPARLCRCGVFGALFGGATVLCCIYFMVTGEYEQFSAEVGMALIGCLECAAAAGVAMISKKLLAQIEEVQFEVECEK